MKTAWLCLAIGTTALGCGGGGGGSAIDAPMIDAPTMGSALFTPKPECQGASVVPFTGMHPQVISSLAIGGPEDGFDLNGDGVPDNKLSAISSLAGSSIKDSFTNYSIVLPFEFFDAPTAAPDTCVKFAIYIGDYVVDNDGDGSKDYIAGGDCNDSGSGSAIHPGATEIPGNLIDDNCDGRADETGSGSAGNSTNTVDNDKDGFSPAQGDCDDTNPNVHPGAIEICGNGIDEDCDGVADRTNDGSGGSLACSPYGGSADITLDPESFVGSAAAIAFKDGEFITGSGGQLQLVAGPDLFSVNVPVSKGVFLELVITGATIQADVVAAADGGYTLQNAKLGGVIDAHTADTIRGLTVSQIGLTPDDSLLDAVFANLLGPLLALPLAKDSVTTTYKNCRTPDIDVDGDGLEAYCDSNPDDDVKTVDTCIDGDGTVIMDTGSGSDTVQCTTAKTTAGKFRFVDGISVELNFATAEAHSLLQPPSPQ
jgi:hypothetical protein